LEQNEETKLPPGYLNHDLIRNNMWAALFDVSPIRSNPMPKQLAYGKETNILGVAAAQGC
jgi:hypothetical protein